MSSSAKLHITMFPAIAFLLVTYVNFVSAYQMFQAFIPNGPNVPDPCQPNITWPGVGHKLIGGTGDRNPFGSDFASNNEVWTQTLCYMDSDGDGRSNGVELGDPNCVWSANGGTPPTFKTGLTHPGICEPVTSPLCLSLNSWLSCKAFSCPAFTLNTTLNISLTLPRTSVLVQQTTYMCLAYKLPNDSNYQIIGLKPILNNTGVVHHMLLYGCPSGVDASISFTTPTTCGMGLPGCQTLLGLWSVGIDGLCFSTEYGLPMGQNGIQYAVLQVHWNNALLIPSQFDCSGLMLFYTSQLRKNNGQILMIGQNYLNIPPNEEAVAFTGSCSSECTMFMPYNVQIATAFLHMHLLGSAGDIQLIRGNTTSTILTSLQYDYNAPTYLTYDTPIPLLAGDELRIDCIYNSMGRNTTTMYGPATTDEMCFGFITIYPAITGFDMCIQFKDLAGCEITPLLNFPRCNWDNFQYLLGLIGKFCMKTCTGGCRGLIDLAYKTGCMDGTLGEWLCDWAGIEDPGFGMLLNATQNICGPRVMQVPPTMAPQNTPTPTCPPQIWYYNGATTYRAPYLYAITVISVGHYLLRSVF